MKNIITVLIFTVIICAILSVCIFAEQDGPRVYGDADNNGILTANDSTGILNKALDNSYDKYLDADNDGILTGTDSALVLMKVLNRSYRLPIEDSEKNDEPASIPQTGTTKPVPADYNLSSAKPGKVEQLTYASEDYAGTGESIEKTAYVYLPYRYDENDKSTKYNILYLMHGWGGSAGEYFTIGNGKIKNMLDNMIEKGEIPPMIVVSPSFYNDNSSSDFGNSVRELREFHNDFKNHLMPAVEGRYNTYARSVSPSDLAAARDHRAFGGFSLGSVTTWNEFCYDYDYIRYFLPMSGSCWYYGGYGDFQTENNVNFIEQLVKDNSLDERGYFIYHAVGTQDSVKSQTIMQADEMLKRNDIFTPEHYVFYQKEGGYHDFDAVQEYMYNALPLFFKAGTENNEPETKEYFTKNTPISQVTNDPVFEDYGRLIFPVDEEYYSGTTLGELRMTWYNYIDPDKTVEITNYLKNHAENGDTVFYDIYTDEEKAADPRKNDTGLFFFKGSKNGKTAICNAGGGFVYVGAMHDSFPHALELSKKGYNAFALIYRPGEQTACQDLARAISFIYEHADEIEVDMTDYSLWGGSAGARMAARLGSRGVLYYGGSNIPKPAAVIMQYTGYTDVNNDPPTYNCVGTSDGIASYTTMENRINALKALGTDAEIEIFHGLPHGFGLGTRTSAEGWINRAIAFWERQMQ